MSFAIARRTLLAAGAAASALGALPAFALEGRANAAGGPFVAVIGAGLAGLCAAAEAASKGCRVVVFEKRPRIGGSAAISTGFFNAADPADAGLLRIHVEETMRTGMGLGKRALIEKLCAEAPGALLWLEERGAVMRPGRYRVYGANEALAHQPVSGSGASFVRAAARAAQSAGAAILTSHPLKALKPSPAGAAPQIVVAPLSAAGESGRDFALTPDAVVLASGGFAANEALCTTIDERLRGLRASAASGSTGEVMLAAAEGCGAALTDMDFIQCVPGAVPGADERVPLHLLLDAFIWLNAEGRRFVAEDASRSAVRDAFLSQPGKCAYAVADAVGFADFAASQQQLVRSAVLEGKAWQADTVDELARRMGLSAEAVRASVEEFNAAVSTGIDRRLGRKALKHRIEKPPFYASASAMNLHSSLGGLEIDASARVISREGEPIPGLYAAGEAAGGLHGEDRLGGNGLCEAAVFGLAAGREAAQYASRAARARTA